MKKKTNVPEIKSTANQRELKCKLVEREIVTLDKVFAEKFLDLDQFRGERPVDRKRVNLMRAAFYNNTFNANICIIAVCYLKKRLIAINGRHTCTALTSLDDELVFPGVQFQTYRAKSWQEIETLYASFDRNFPRTPAHATDTYLCNHRLLRSLPASTRRKMAAPFKVWQFPEAKERRVYSPEQIGPMMLAGDHVRAVQLTAQFLLDACAGPDCKPIRRAPVTAAIMATAAHRPTLFEKFWHPIATQIGLLSKYDPRYQLLHFLRDHDLATSHDSKKKRASADTIYNMSLACWNTWRTNPDTTAVIAPPELRPVLA
jgi:hypothetical protein